MPTSRQFALGTSDVAALVVILPALAVVRTWLR
jgi:hypothetical protein